MRGAAEVTKEWLRAHVLSRRSSPGLRPENRTTWFDAGALRTLVPDPAPPGRGLVGKGEIVGAATVVGVYRALLEDRGSVAGRTPESADLCSPNGSTPPTRSRADPAAPFDQQPCGARQASCA